MSSQQLHPSVTIIYAVVCGLAIMRSYRNKQNATRWMNRQHKKDKKVSGLPWYVKELELYD